MPSFVGSYALFAMASVGLEPGASTPVAPIPPPVEQTAANCEQPSYATDVLVCSNVELRALDARVREAYIEVAQTLDAVESPYFEAQPLWLRRRSMCAFEEQHIACVSAAYWERLNILDAVAATRLATRQYGCIGPRGKPRLSATKTTSGAITLWQGPVLYAVAVPTSPPPGWLQEVGVKENGNRLTLSHRGLPSINCQKI